MAEAKKMSREEYLKRYLSGDAKVKKKRKIPKTKLPVKKTMGLRIIDNDDEFFENSLQSSRNKQEESDDEAPTIAEIVDERPQKIKTLEQYDSKRWKKVADNDSEEDHHDETPISQTSDDGTSQFSSMRTSRRRHDSDSDCSPPRSRATTSDNESRHDSPDVIRPSSRRRHDSDLSPPRKMSSLSMDDGRSSMKKSSKKQDSDHDLSPPRKAVSSTLDDRRSSMKKSSKKPDSDDDLSPPRRNGIEERNPNHSKNNPNEIKDRRTSNNSSSSKSHKKSTVTLSGLKAGLQYASTLQREVKELRKREKQHISSMAAEHSGRNAQTVHRNRDTGKIVDLEEERRKVEESAKELAKKTEKYAVWGKGIEQQNAQKDRLETDVYEMTKPLARYKDDEDLDKIMREKDREGDPMLAYMKKKKQKTQTVPVLPSYSGPAAPPNRFNLEPGYRWDGVDRSNGFEKKYFDKVNAAKSKEVENHLWSVQDM